MKRRRVQVTCLCSAYEFPHRLGGGYCTGDEWARSYFELVGDCCRYCIANRGFGECDVACGAESISVCEGVRDHALYQSVMRLPVTLEKEMQRKLFIYQENQELDRA